jgi:hypothetical protein
MASILVDYRAVVAKNNLEHLLSRVGPPPDTTLEIGLVLVIPKTVLDELDGKPRGSGRIKFLDSSSFVGTIQGVAYLMYDPEREVAEIAKSDGNMVAYIVSASLYYLPENTTLVAATGTSRGEWEPYVRYGFRNPFLSSRTPLLGQGKGEMLILSRCNAVVEKPEAGPAVEYLLKQSGRSSACSVTYRLTGEAHRYLKSLASGGSSLNGDGSVSQKEVSGILRVVRVEKGGIHVLEVDRDSLKLGEEEGAVPAKSLYTFHSHPREAYERNGVSVAWPSCQDFHSYLTLAVLHNTIAHFVATLEGLYVVSLSKYWARRKDELRKNSLEFVRKAYDVKRTEGRTPEWFVQETKKVKFGDHPLFVVQFEKWSTNPRMHAFFSRAESNCLADQGSVDAAKRL